MKEPFEPTPFELAAVIKAHIRSLEILSEIMEQEPLINPRVMDDIRKNALRIVELANMIDEEIR
jgi:hypothetical protein